MDRTLQKKTGIFSFFKLRKEERLDAEKPKDLRTWIVHGLSEYFGTILISLFLAGLSIYVSSHKGKPLVIEEYLLHPIIVGFFAGFVAVGTVLFIFLRWSCDLNPSVTLYRYLSGKNNGYYASYKLFIQILGAITAGLIIHGVGLLTAPTIEVAGQKVQVLSNAPIDALSSAAKAFEPVKGTPSIAKGGTWIFFVEMVMTSVLLLPIFSPNINNKYRDLFIMTIISFSVWMGILGGTAAINPARGFAQQASTLFFHGGQNDSAILAHAHLKDYVKFFGESSATDTGQSALQVIANKHVYSSVVIATAAMILGDLAAPFFYLFVQGITEKYINPAIVSIIGYKNYKALNMETPRSNQK
ncbi:aquaporin [Mycoplasmopsis gallopavonis]|uniref:Uncharacterized protein n=1 Tax=Mycoplasmopsis gallopavonis TaxID=76629 RepID=A0A449AZI8_9BACT|nr:aquaporin [Mycoplasmopsis gallopavonis]RIV16789.1 hypothetical protein D1113_00920 [Mycoplasmopsis gallopavonis]VEU72912.1 Uncharacterised protein [Mycoplasmopsis gallopavonis]